jgi:hypothetical protein
MGRATDSITYLYEGPMTVCGMVDAMPFRDGPLGSPNAPAGQSPFVYIRAPKPAGEGGIDYEDYFLNRTEMFGREQANNISEIEKNCGVPYDWETVCGPDPDHPATGKPRFCKLMAARRILVLEAHANGCPIF